MEKSYGASSLNGSHSLQKSASTPLRESQDNPLKGNFAGGKYYTGYLGGNFVAEK